MPRCVRSFEDYAKIDFAIGDNDPVYFAVHASVHRYGEDWATRFCVAMLAYYDMGVAVVAADREGKEFWDYLRDIYPTAPRGNMRRHFRGAGGMATLDSMIVFSPKPEDFFKRMPGTYAQITKVCGQALYGFGPMFVLKIVDYMVCCLGFKVFGMNELSNRLPTQPAKAVGYLYPGVGVAHGFDMICSRIEKLELLAPPTYDRPVGPAEVETALCDWKTAKYGSNWLGSDIIAKRQTLMGKGPKADWMATRLPPNVEQSTFKLELE